MIRVTVHRTEVPSGTPYLEWTNISGDVLLLEPPGVPALQLGPDGRLQIPCSDLATVPILEPWLEGCELRGLLRTSA